jgi:hypothetical protein
VRFAVIVEAGEGVLTAPPAQILLGVERAAHVRAEGRVPRELH